MDVLLCNNLKSVDRLYCKLICIKISLLFLNFCFVFLTTFMACRNVFICPFVHFWSPLFDVPLPLFSGYDVRSPYWKCFTVSLRGFHAVWTSAGISSRFSYVDLPIRNLQSLFELNFSWENSALIWKRMCLSGNSPLGVKIGVSGSWRWIREPPPFTRKEPFHFWSHPRFQVTEA